jgi:hypothetical protein
MGLLPRILFVSTMGLALLFGTTVLVAPPIARLSAARNAPVIQLFAKDATLRRTTLASAVGLAVTAWIFFRTPRAARPAASESPAPIGGA